MAPDGTASRDQPDPLGETAPPDRPEPPDEPDPLGQTVVWDLRVTVERVEGRAVCGLGPGDWFEVTGSSRLRLPDGGHFCLYALAAVLPLLAAKQRDLPAGDWLQRDTLVACPDPDERLVMRIDRVRRRRIPTAELT